MLRLTDFETGITHIINTSSVALIQECIRLKGYEGPTVWNLISNTGNLLVTTTDPIPQHIHQDWLKGFSTPLDKKAIDQMYGKGLKTEHTFATYMDPNAPSFFICCPANHQINERQYAHLQAHLGDVRIHFFMDHDPFAPLPSEIDK